MYIRKTKELQSGVSYEINDITGVRFSSNNMQISVDIAGFTSLEKRSASMNNTVEGSSLTESFVLDIHSQDPTMVELLQAYAVLKQKLFNHILTLPNWDGGEIQQG